MTTEQEVICISVPVHANYSANQYYAVKLTTVGRAQVAGAGQRCIGILQNDPDAAGKVGSVAVYGLAPAIYGGIVTAGDSLTPDASGKLVTAGGNDNVCAIAFTSGVANQIGKVLLIEQFLGTFPNGTQGDVLYYNGANWVVLGAGTDGQLLQTQGASANPAWSNIRGEFTLAIPIDLKSVADGDVLTDYVLGYAGTISKVDARVVIPVTTGGKSTSLNLEIGSINLDGGVVALTSANCTPLGHAIAGSAVTGHNTFGAADAISIEAASTTAFSEGMVVLLIQIAPTLAAV